MICVSCQKKEVIPNPDFQYALSSELLRKHLSVFPVNESITFSNRSVDGVNYIWNFGNGITSKESNPVVQFQQAGNYSVQLTTVSKTGTRATTTQNIKIVDRMIKRVLINRLNYETIPGWNNTKKVDLKMEVVLKGTSQGSSLLYKSETLKNIPGTRTSLELPVELHTVLNVNDSEWPDLVINLIGNDGSGPRTIASTQYSGGGCVINFSPEHSSYLIIGSFLGNSITIELGYDQ